MRAIVTLPAYVCVCVCVSNKHTHTNTHTSVHTHTHVCVFACVCVCVCVCVCAYFSSRIGSSVCVARSLRAASYAQNRPCIRQHASAYVKHTSAFAMCGSVCVSNSLRSSSYAQNWPCFYLYVFKTKNSVCNDSRMRTFSGVNG